MSQIDYNNLIQPDISIFNQNGIQIYHSTSNCDYDHKKCPSIIRLSVALKYYEKLEIMNNHSHQQIFTNFISAVYSNFLNDIVHFHTKHGHQIEEIHNDFITDQGFGQCQIRDCLFTSRHHQPSELSKSHSQPSSPTKFDFYKQVMDTLHFYIFHMFHAGLRSVTSTIRNEETKEDNKMMSKYFDPQLSRMRQSLSITNRNTELFERFTRGKNSKFTIETECDGKYDDCIQDTDDEFDGYVETYLENIFLHLESNRIDPTIIGILIDFVQNENYDTEAVSMDLYNTVNNCNISRCVGDLECVRIIAEYMKSAESMTIHYHLYLLLYHI